LVAKYDLWYKKLYEKKIDKLLKHYDRFDMAEEEVFLASEMIFALNLGPIEKLTLFAIAKSKYRGDNHRATYKELAADVGCSEEYIVVALHVINERFESGEIYHNFSLQ